MPGSADSTAEYRGKLHPAVAKIREAVRTALADLPQETTVLVACSGGADSLALAAATAFEAIVIMAMVTRPDMDTSTPNLNVNL